MGVFARMMEGLAAEGTPLSNPRRLHYCLGSLHRKFPSTILLKMVHCSGQLLSGVGEFEHPNKKGEYIAEPYRPKAKTEVRTSLAMATGKRSRSNGRRWRCRVLLPQRCLWAEPYGTVRLASCWLRAPGGGLLCDGAVERLEATYRSLSGHQPISRGSLDTGIFCGDNGDVDSVVVGARWVFLLVSVAPSPKNFSRCSRSCHPPMADLASNNGHRL